MRKAIFLLISGLLVFASGCTLGHNQAKPTPIPLFTPGGLTATAGDKQVSLTWGAVASASSYAVYYSSQSGAAKGGTKLPAGTSDSPKLTVTGLTNGTPYYFVVTALGDAGETSPSSEVSATPVPPIPAAPTGVTATAGPDQVVLSWTASTGATSYNVYYATSSTITKGGGTKIGGITAPPQTVTGLTAGTTYYFIVTAVNAGGESAASTAASATPTSNGTVSLTPGTAGTATVAFSAANSLTFNFPANAVSSPATVGIVPVTQGALPVALSQSTRAHAAAVPEVQATDTFIVAFKLTIDPTTITLFNVPVGVSGTVDPTVSAAGTTLNLAILSDQKWVDVATFVVGANGALTENLASTTLQGLLAPGTYLLYKPATGTNTAVSNLGIALIADDGYDMADGKNGLQIIHLYDKNGNLLSTPVISYLDYPNQGDLDGQALTPDGSQGIMVDGGNYLSFFSAAQTGVPVASTNNLDISNWGFDGDSVGIMPNGDEAVVSLDSNRSLLVVSGIVSGKPVAAETLNVPEDRDGVAVSNDGKVMLARGGDGLTVFSVADITPVDGNAGGKVAHSYTQVTDIAAMGTNYDIEDGRDGMAFSPVDSSRAVLLFPYTNSIQLVTGLPANPAGQPALQLPSGAYPQSVSISPDGKLAVVGTERQGLFLLSGVDTGNLALVGTAYAPSYTLDGASVTLLNITTLGITLDGKYVVAGDQQNQALVVIPFKAAGFASAPASVLGKVAIPSNDQLLIH